MSCYCGDIQCPSCGPAQGNSRCPICGTWLDDVCEHFDEEGELIGLSTYSSSLGNMVKLLNWLLKTHGLAEALDIQTGQVHDALKEVFRGK